MARFEQVTLQLSECLLYLFQISIILNIEDRLLVCTSLIVILAILIGLNWISCGISLLLLWAFWTQAFWSQVLGDAMDKHFWVYCLLFDNFLFKYV